MRRRDLLRGLVCAATVPAALVAKKSEATPRLYTKSLHVDSCSCPVDWGSISLPKLAADIRIERAGRADHFEITVINSSDTPRSFLVRAKVVRHGSRLQIVATIADDLAQQLFTRAETFEVCGEIKISLNHEMMWMMGNYGEQMAESLQAMVWCPARDGSFPVRSACPAHATSV